MADCNPTCSTHSHTIAIGASAISERLQTAGDVPANAVDRVLPVREGGPSRGWRRGRCNRGQSPGLESTSCVTSCHLDAAIAAPDCREEHVAPIAAVEEADVVASACCRKDGPPLTACSVLLHIRKVFSMLDLFSKNIAYSVKQNRLGEILSLDAPMQIAID